MHGIILVVLDSEYCEVLSDLVLGQVVAEVAAPVGVCVVEDRSSKAVAELVQVKYVMVHLTDRVSLSDRDALTHREELAGTNDEWYPAAGACESALYRQPRLGGGRN